MNLIRKLYNEHHDQEFSLFNFETPIYIITTHSSIINIILHSSTHIFLIVGIAFDHLSRQDNVLKQITISIEIKYNRQIFVDMLKIAHLTERIMLYFIILKHQLTFHSRQSSTRGCPQHVEITSNLCTV
jgi:hypothetical protein